MTSQAVLLCSTRYQVIATYDAYSSMEQVLGGLPQELLRIIQKYYGHTDVPRSQENNSLARWKSLQNNPIFQTIALSTDLFRFAIHGIEERLPANLGERFGLIEQRIPTLYPTKRSITLDECTWTTTMIPSVLDLSRIPPVTSSPSFDPYHPERWGTSLEHRDPDHFVEGVPFWQQRCRYYGVTARHAIDRDNHLPKGNPTALNEQILLGSIITPQGAVYCPLLFQDMASGGSVDNILIDLFRASSRLHELSWLPIAREAVQSAPYNRKATVDFALYASTDKNSTTAYPFDFIYRRVHEEPDADITDADFLRTIDAKLPEGTTLAAHYGSSRTNAPPEIPKALIQQGLDLLESHTSKNTSKGNP